MTIRRWVRPAPPAAPGPASRGRVPALRAAAAAAFLLVLAPPARPDADASSEVDARDLPTSSIGAPFRPEGPGEPVRPEHGKAVTADATPADPGSVEVEIAYGPSWWANGGELEARPGSMQPLVLSVAVGVLPDVDVKAALGWATVHQDVEPGAAGAGPGRGSGQTDAALGARWRFLSLEAPAVDVAVIAGATIPTGARTTAASLGTTQGYWSVGGALVASADWGRWTGNAELGLVVPLGGQRGDDVGTVVANLAVGHQLTPWVQPALELNYQHGFEAGPAPDEEALWATAAAVVPVAPARLVVGMRWPLHARHVAAGPAAVLAFKLAF
jgi:hypothetical protein